MAELKGEKHGSFIASTIEQRQEWLWEEMSERLERDQDIFWQELHYSGFENKRPEMMFLVMYDYYASKFREDNEVENYKDSIARMHKEWEEKNEK